MVSKDKKNNLYEEFYDLSNQELFDKLDNSSVLQKINAIDVLSTRINDNDVLDHLIDVISDKESQKTKAVGFLSISDITIILLLKTKSPEIESIIDNILQSRSEAEKDNLLIYLRSQKLYD